MSGNNDDTKRWEKITRIGIVLGIIVAILTIIGFVSGFIGVVTGIVSSAGHVVIVASPTVGATSSPVSTATPMPSPTATITPVPGGGPYEETAGGYAHTWTDYASAGGIGGPTVAAQQSVLIACKVTGFEVPDGNTWWYRIASSPWNNKYYVSADAFYNNGAHEGPLKNTPFVDPRVVNC